MSAGARHEFSFELTAAEAREAQRVAQQALFRAGRYTRWRLLEIAAFIGVGALFGFAVAPLLLDQVSIADEVGFAISAYVITALGAFTERFCSAGILKTLRRRQAARLAAPRTVTLTAACAEVDGAGWLRREGWDSFARMVRARSVLVLQFFNGEWIAIPRRLLGDGAADLERDIAAWHAAAVPAA